MILLDPEARAVIGHRGASGEYPENTLAAFEQAIADGADALELDVRLSADGVPVVIHDETVDRTTNGRGAVAALTAEELSRLDAGGGARIPTFKEVLARFDRVPLIVEIKAVPAAEPVLRLLRWFGAEQRVIVGSFAHAALLPFRARGVATSASRRETARWWLATRLGLVPRGAPFRAFTVPETHGRLRVVDARFTRRARERGLPVHVWTVNEAADARRLWALGVNGVISNFPGRIRHAAPPGGGTWTV